MATPKRIPQTDVLEQLVTKLLARYENPETKLGRIGNEVTRDYAELLYFLNPTDLPALRDRETLRNYIRQIWKQNWTQERIKSQLETTLHQAENDLRYNRILNLIAESKVIKIAGIAKPNIEESKLKTDLGKFLGDNTKLQNSEGNDSNSEDGEINESNQKELIKITKELLTEQGKNLRIFLEKKE